MLTLNLLFRHSRIAMEEELGATSPVSRPKSTMSVTERTFLTPKQGEAEENVPSLDEFDTEIDIYRVS